MLRLARIKKELNNLQQNPLAGVTFWETNDISQLKASIIGPDGSPYENGIFKLDVQIPEKYPFEPPKPRFLTPVYHPNIDGCGRICLDVLKLPPSGSWKPTRDLAGVLTSIQLLLRDPNPDDPLMPEIAQEFRSDHSAFERKAKNLTLNHAMTNTSAEEAAESNHTTEPPPSKKICL